LPGDEQIAAAQAVDTYSSNRPAQSAPGRVIKRADSTYTGSKNKVSLDKERNGKKNKLERIGKCGSTTSHVKIYPEHVSNKSNAVIVQNLESSAINGTPSNTNETACCVKIVEEAVHVTTGALDRNCPEDKYEILGVTDGKADRLEHVGNREIQNRVEFDGSEVNHKMYFSTSGVEKKKENCSRGNIVIDVDDSFKSETAVASCNEVGQMCADVTETGGNCTKADSAYVTTSDCNELNVSGSDHKDNSMEIVNEEEEDCHNIDVHPTNPDGGTLNADCSAAVENVLEVGLHIDTLTLTSVYAAECKRNMATAGARNHPNSLSIKFNAEVPKCKIK